MEDMGIYQILLCFLLSHSLRYEFTQNTTDFKMKKNCPKLDKYRPQKKWDNNFCCFIKSKLSK